MTVRYYLHTDVLKRGERAIILKIRGVIRPKKDRRLQSERTNAGREISLTIGRRIKPELWDNELQRVKKKVTGAPELNAFLDFCEREITRHYELLRIEKRLTFEEMKRFALNLISPDTEPIKPEKTLSMLIEEYLQVKRFDLAENTKKKYVTLLGYVERFAGKNTDKLLVSRLNIGFYDDFRVFLLSDVGLQNNTILKVFSLMKTVLHFAQERGNNVNLDFKRVKKLKSEAVQAAYLTEQELFALYHYEFKSDTLNKVRDVFCLQCFTGQRFSDIAGFKFSDIKDGFWTLRTQKTKQPLEIPLNQYALEILARYRKAGKLPVISAQKTNSYVKEACQIAGINDMMTVVHYRGNERIERTAEKWNFIASHTARRTFVTLSLQRGMRPETVMKITGHTDAKMLKKYIILSSNVAQKEMQQTWGDLRVIKGGRGKAV